MVRSISEFLCLFTFRRVLKILGELLSECQKELVEIVGVVTFNAYVLIMRKDLEI